MNNIRICFINGNVQDIIIYQAYKDFIENWRTMQLMYFNDGTLCIPWHYVRSIELLPNEQHQVTASGGIYTGETVRLER